MRSWRGRGRTSARSVRIGGRGEVIETGSILAETSVNELSDRGINPPLFVVPQSLRDLSMRLGGAAELGVVVAWWGCCSPPRRKRYVRR